MSNVIFITGIGTDVGKTVAAAILAEALEADYWKPVQAGFSEGTDAELVRSLLTPQTSVVHPETYKLKLAASPHIGAREEGIKTDLDKIAADFRAITSNVKNLIIEGAGGLMVPLNEEEFVIDLVKKLNARVILVSRNYLGSINHSLMTAAVCKQNDLHVLGWIFNDHYLNYEEEIVQWSGFPKIASIPASKKIDAAFIKAQAPIMKNALINFL
ncbi:MAG TPA: dethiobiotin synthase [Parafilimonas sp.]|nr:dethiobiotin synthase [Parafilimonas sp.]